MKSAFRTFQIEVERHRSDVEQEEDFWRSLDRCNHVLSTLDTHVPSESQLQLAQRALHSMGYRRDHGEDTPAGIRAWADRLARDAVDASDAND